MSFGAFFGIFWPDKSLTLSRISETNFGLDQLEDLICSCARTKLYLLLIFPTTYYLQSSIETELICLSIQTNHLPCAKSLRPISALTNLRTSSAVALGPNSICYLFSYYVLLTKLHRNRIDLVYFWRFLHFLARQITYLVRNLWGQFWPWPIWGPRLQLRWDQTLWRGIGHPWSGIEHRWAFGWSYTRSLVWRVAIVFALFQVSCENTKSKNTVCFIRNHSKYTMNQINKSIFDGKTKTSRLEGGHYLCLVQSVLWKH